VIEVVAQHREAIDAKVGRDPRGWRGRDRRQLDREDLAAAPVANVELAEGDNPSTSR
jgi:hypothetical protein